MPICAKCSVDKDPAEFYARDRTCKECRKALVRQNRAQKANYYREYDKQRANQPDRVAARLAYSKTEAGREAHKKAKRRYIERNPLRRAAQVALCNAVRDGRVWRAPCCMAPGCFNQGRLHGHHTHYDNALSVVWLCIPCHAEVHKQFDEFVH